MADTLAKLARLRRMEAEAAKRDLATAVTNERLAQRALTQAQASVALEARVPVPAVPGAFAAWLPAAAQAIARCKAAETEATRQRGAAREALAQRLAAQKAVDTVVAARAEDDRVQAERRAERSRNVPQRKE
jgi:F420-0:gamma-glutamyl ligase-like protein